MSGPIWKLVRANMFDPDEYIGVFVSHDDALEIAKERVADWLDEGEEPVIESEDGVTTVTTPWIGSMYRVEPIIAFTAQEFREHYERMVAKMDAELERIKERWNNK